MVRFRGPFLQHSAGSPIYYPNEAEQQVCIWFSGTCAKAIPVLWTCPTLGTVATNCVFLQTLLRNEQNQTSKQKQNQNRASSEGFDVLVPPDFQWATTCGPGARTWGGLVQMRKTSRKPEVTPVTSEADNGCHRNVPNPTRSTI